MKYNLSFFEFLMKFLKIYNETQQYLNNNIYRVIELKERANCSPILVVQVIGKASIFEVTPEEIVKNDSMLEGFSKNDIKTIVLLASKDKTDSDYTIIAQDICGESSTIVYKLRQIKNQEIITKSAAQIALDQNLIKSLNPIDALNVGYAAGLENALNLNNEFKVKL